MAVYQVSSQVLVAQSCLTLCSPIDFSQPGSSVHGILRARILEWVAIPFSRGSSWPRDQTQSPALQAVSLPPEPWSLWGRALPGLFQLLVTARIRWPMAASLPSLPPFSCGVVPFCLSPCCLTSSFFKWDLFIYFCLLCCCAWAFSSCGEWGLLSSCGVQASHHCGVSCCGAEALEHWLSSCGIWA